MAAGKHVLCEKPFTLNQKQSAELIDYAQRHKLFLMEAVWMRFIPAIAKLREWVADGVVGEIVSVAADFNFHLPFDANNRLFNRELGGGALLDLGIYPLSLTTMLLGFPDSIESHAVIGATGVDESDGLLLRYASGAVALLTCGMRSNRPVTALIAGTRGHITIPAPFLRPDRLILQRNGEEAETHHIPYRSNGYAHEVLELHACLERGQFESAIMPLAETQQMMALMDSLRQDWGVSYVGED
jgi:predicted dehydrogenase